MWHGKISPHPLRLAHAVAHPPHPEQADYAPYLPIS